MIKARAHHLKGLMGASSTAKKEIKIFPKIPPMTHSRCLRPSLGQEVKGMRIQREGDF